MKPLRTFFHSTNFGTERRLCFKGNETPGGGAAEQANESADTAPETKEKPVAAEKPEEAMRQQKEKAQKELADKKEAVKNAQKSAEKASGKPLFDVEKVEKEAAATDKSAEQTENTLEAPEAAETGPGSEIDKALNTIKSKEATTGEKIEATLAALAILKSMWDQVFGVMPPEGRQGSAAEQTSETADEGSKEEKENGNEEASEQSEESPDTQKDRLKKEIEAAGSVDVLIEEKEQIATKETAEVQEKLDKLDGEIDTLKGDVTKLEGGKRDLEQELASTDDEEVRKDLQMEIDRIDARIEARNKEITIVEKRHDELLERKRSIDDNEGKDVETLRAMRKAFETMQDTVTALQENLGDRIPEGMDIIFDADTLTVRVTLTDEARKTIKELGITLEGTIDITKDGVVEDPRQLIAMLQALIEAPTKQDKEKEGGSDEQSESNEKTSDLSPAKDAPVGQIRQDNDGNYWQKGEDGMWNSYHDPANDMSSDSGYRGTKWGDSLMNERGVKIVEVSKNPDNQTGAEQSSPQITETEEGESVTSTEKPEEQLSQERLNVIRRDMATALARRVGVDENSDTMTTFRNAIDVYQTGDGTYKVEMFKDLLGKSSLGSSNENMNVVAEDLHTTGGSNSWESDPMTSDELLTYYESFIARVNRRLS